MKPEIDWKPAIFKEKEPSAENEEISTVDYVDDLSYVTKDNQAYEEEIQKTSL